MGHPGIVINGAEYLSVKLLHVTLQRSVGIIECDSVLTNFTAVSGTTVGQHEDVLIIARYVVFVAFANISVRKPASTHLLRAIV